MLKHFRLLFTLLLLLPAPLELKAEPADRVAAVINGDVITQSELQEEGAKIFEKIMTKAPEAERPSLLKKARAQILSQLIDKTLLRQQAVKTGLHVTEEDIDNAIAGILNRSGLSLKEFQQDLAERGMSEQFYRDSLRDQILISRLVTRQVRDKIVITHEKIADYYKTEYLNQPVPAGYHILQIGITWSDSDSLYKSREEAAAKAAEVQKLAAEGKNFRELAKAFSTLPSARDGGDLGAFSRDELASYMRDPIIKLKPGQISDVISTPSSFQIFKLQSIREGDQSQFPPLDMVQEEIKDKLMQDESNRQYENWLIKLRAEAYIKRLVE
ncbi:MAG: hypothetical protein A2511_03900 [Deltaproteobacteria bacterium RIFOXYD12_FULL_50_9]|nr:MAG: hypothetical protein A2511_03900 [Deltaproteobacteria bacterium RIFOXYD12_FULL_50_9]